MKKGPPSSDSATLLGALTVLALFFGVLLYDKIPNLPIVLTDFLSELYWTSYALVCLASALILYAIKQTTLGMADRWRKLSVARPQSDSTLVGRTTDGLLVSIPQKIRTGHVQIIGATGRGKTESVVVPWICRDLLAGHNVILIDGKGDPDIVNSISNAAQLVGVSPRVFDLGNFSKSIHTNPLAHGSSQQITDRIFTAFSFDEAYYKSVQFDVASSAIHLLLKRDSEVTFYSLYRVLTDEQELTDLLREFDDNDVADRLHDFLSLPGKERIANLSGLVSQLSPFAIGEVNSLLNPSNKGANSTIQLSSVLLSNSLKQTLTVFLIPTLKYQEIGHQLGKLLLQELAWAVGERSSNSGSKSLFVPIYLDEFSAFVYQGFGNILNKARSSNVAFHLSHQSLADLEAVSRDFSKTVITNTNVKCLLGLNDPEDAERFAKHLGTFTQDKLTEKAMENGIFRKSHKRTGEVSIREVEGFKIHPNRLKNYMNGAGVLHMPTPYGNLTEEMQFDRFTAPKRTRS